MMNYRSAYKKIDEDIIMQESKPLDYFEQLIDDIQMLILFFLPPSNYINMCFCYSSLLKRIINNEQIAKYVFKLYKSINKHNTVCCYNTMYRCFRQTDLFKVYSRIIYYNTNFGDNTQNMILNNLYKSTHRREQLSDIYSTLYISNNTHLQNGSIFNHYNTFKKNLNNWFHFQKWRNLLAENMVLAGGAITHCLVAKQKLKTIQDIDIFMIEQKSTMGHYSFKRYIQQFVNMLYTITNQPVKFYISCIYVGHQVATIYVNFSNYFTLLRPQANFQEAERFIETEELFWTKIQIINPVVHTKLWQLLANFDIDCCQVAMVKDSIMCTNAFLQSWKTHSIISYKENQIGLEFSKRLNKYVYRYNLTKLTPIIPTFTPFKEVQDIKNVLMASARGEEILNLSCDYPLFVNCDFLCVLNSFNKLFDS